MDNRFIIEGRIGRLGERRVTPAGIPISRIRLEHSSGQPEAGTERQVSLAVTVVVTGEPLNQRLNGCSEGDGVRVSGFLAQAGYRHERELVLHARRLERIELASPEPSKEND